MPQSPGRHRPGVSPPSGCPVTLEQRGFEVCIEIARLSHSGFSAWAANPIRRRSLCRAIVSEIPPEKKVSIECAEEILSPMRPSFRQPAVKRPERPTFAGLARTSQRVTCPVGRNVPQVDSRLPECDEITRGSWRCPGIPKPHLGQHWCQRLVNR